MELIQLVRVPVLETKSIALIVSITFLLKYLILCLFLACPCFGECYDGCEDCDNPICGGTNSCKNLELYIDYQVCKSIESELLGDCVTDCAG